MHVLPSAVRKCGAVLMRVYRIQQAQLGILVQLWDKVDADRVATLAAAKRAHDLAAAEAADAEARAAEAEAKTNRQSFQDEGMNADRLAPSTAFSSD